MSVPYEFDIAIIGGGITGLSAAFHLQKLGFSRLCLFSKEADHSTTAHAAGFISGGMADNFTRLSHPRGIATAKQIWDFCDHAYDSLVEYLQKAGIPHQNGERLRWMISEAEVAEAQKAVQQLHAEGLAASWQATSPSTSGVSSPRLLGTQNEGQRATAVSLPALLHQLRADTRVTTFGEAQSFQSTGDGIEVTHAGGKVRAEFLICAQHLSIADLLPNLAEALVPFADQWSEYQLHDQSKVLPWKPGTVFSWQHSHIWGVVTGPGTLRIGGGRYLRAMAGIEAKVASYEQKIMRHLAEAWNGLWPELAIEPSGTGFGIRDCRPCDELPLIGPMFGEGRVLVATGYMGQGLSLGFTAGRCLAELIADQPTKLPRLLWPERLRSLPADKGEES
ncbi:MAG TPA: FAD-binding oxidoreductase [Oligoflexus sp.]|uniref:NAD(P)/FAD-dependent oxidoreductase n=1 Tax=Oligoflexus sp. TaxID=1971216 RepID=UPI002D56F945|nr:FAD-binding oxidoreductase [Oligoflexus sp.]HYX39471.1 FAD-binding oxidoreductase [Oligoflexus sp.]